MEKKLDIRAFQDGKDYVLVFRDCSPELKDIVQGFLNPVSVPDLEAESMSPTEEKTEYNPRFSTGSLEGRTPVDVLLEDGDEGYRLLRRERPEDTLLEHERKEAMSLYKTLRFQEVAKTAEVMDREDLVVFIKTFCTKKSLESYMARSGYDDPKEFFDNCEEDILRKVVRKMTKK